jgi:antitoxin (DNA-binding transcriptional repressor) of toxin-antitoxin stability system
MNIPGFRAILLTFSPDSHIIETISSGKETSSMIVTATEFKTNFGKYLDLIVQEDIFITRNGKTIAKVVNPHVSAVDSLRGMLKNVPSDIDSDSLREERLSKYEDHV